MGSRIVAIADVYDALTSDRPYRRALDHREALERMAAEAHRTLDGRLLAIFFDKVIDAPAGPSPRD